MGGFSMKWTKWELSLAVGLAVMLLFCAARGTNTLQWWSAAFSPLCDGILTQSAASGDVVVKSKLAELLALLMGGNDMLCLPFEREKGSRHFLRRLPFSLSLAQDVDQLILLQAREVARNVHIAECLFIARASGVQPTKCAASSSGSEALKKSPLNVRAAIFPCSTVM